MCKFDAMPGGCKKVQCMQDHPSQQQK